MFVFASYRRLVFQWAIIVLRYWLICFYMFMSQLFVINKNRNVSQSNQLHSLLYRWCSVITRNIEINNRGKSTKNVTTSFFQNKDHSCRSFIFCFPFCGEWAWELPPPTVSYFWIVGVIRELMPTVSYLWTLETYLGPLANASHSEAVSA